MGLKFPNGAVLGISTAFAAAAVAVTATSNADPAVATVAAAGGIVAGDVLLVTSNWNAINECVAVAGTIADGTSIPLLGLDTTDTVDFPEGEGTGALLKVADWQDFSQQGDVSTSGGDQQFWTGQFLEDKSGRQRQVPTTKNAQSMSLPLYFDPSLPWYKAAKNVDRKRQPVVLRARLPDGDSLYWYGYLSFNSSPAMAANSPMQNNCTFSINSEVTYIEADA